jgi:zinc protease
MKHGIEKSAEGSMGLLAPVFDAPLERFLLSNGLTVIHRRVSGGLVAVQLWVKTGSIHEAPNLGSGLSHYLEHMLFKGTARRTAPEITAAVQAAGGDINAYTTFDRTVFHVEAPCEGFATAMDVLHDMAFHSLLADGELAREKEVILREIAMNNDDPDRRLLARLYETAYRAHPYRLPVIGHEAQFRTIDPATIRTYFKSRYTPDNMTLVVVGDVELEALELALENTFAKEPRAQSSSPVIPGEPPQLAPRRVRMTGDVTLCRGSMAWKVPGIGHEDSPALDMLAAILGGGESSVLSQNLRMKKQLVSEIDASCWNPGKKGLFWVSYSADSGSAEKVEEAVQAEIEALLKKGISAEDLARVRRMALAGEIDARKTVSGHASRLGLSEVVVGDLLYPRQYFLALDALTPADVVQAGLRYLKNSGITCVSLDAEGAAHRTHGALLRAERAEPEIRILANGARIVLQPDPTLPKVHLRYGGLGGPLYETRENSGATALLATLLTRDTASRDAESVSRIIEAAGGRLEEFCGNNSFGIAMELLSGDLDKGLDLFGEALLSPRFCKETFAVERDGQIARIREDEDDISERGRLLLRRAFFREHPYSRTANGSIEALERLSVRDMQAHYERLVKAGNAVISASGAFDPDRLVPKLEAILARMDSTPFVPAEPPFAGPVRTEMSVRMEREQAIVYRSYAGTGIRGDDYLVSEILDEYLSDMSGPLFVAVREEKGMAYFVGASRMVGLGSGMFTLYAGTRPESAAAVRAEFDKVLADLAQRGIPTSELARAKTRLKARRRLATQTIGARANSALLDALYNLPILTNAQYDRQVDAIGAEDTRLYARAHFAGETCVDFTIGPELAAAESVLTSAPERPR